VRPPTVTGSGRDRAIYALDVALGWWRLREPAGVQRVGRAPPDGPVVLSGNWTFEVHRLEAALRRRGGFLLVLETHGRDLASACRAGLVTPRAAHRALEDPDLPALADQWATPAAAAPPPANPSEPPGPTPEQGTLDGDRPPAQTLEPDEPVDAASAAGPAPLPDARAPRLFVPTALAELLDLTGTVRLAGRPVVVHPDRVGQRVAGVAGEPLRPAPSPATLRDRLELGAMGAAFLSTVALAPLLAVASAATLPALALICLTYLTLAALAPVLPARRIPVHGLVVGAVLELALLLCYGLVAGPPPAGFVLHTAMAFLAVGAWAGRTDFTASGPNSRGTPWASGVVALAALASAATLLWR
jgi:hypothetical protein